MNWKHVRIGLALLAGLGWTFPGDAQGAAADSLKELTKGADLVFRGTVLRPGAANLEIVEPTDKTAVVRVDETLATSGTLDDFTGREVTVFLREAGSVKAGEQGVFFTTVAFLGETLGVVEVGRRGPEDLRAQVATARRQNTSSSTPTPEAFRSMLTLTGPGAAWEAMCCRPWSNASAR